MRDEIASGKLTDRRTDHRPAREKPIGSRSRSMSTCSAAFESFALIGDCFRDRTVRTGRGAVKTESQPERNAR